MRISWRPVHTLKDQIAEQRNWEAQSQREFDEWVEDTEGATLPAVGAFSEAFGTYRRELQGAAEGALQWPCRRRIGACQQPSRCFRNRVSNAAAGMLTF